jgi:hypothetical protein
VFGGYVEREPDPERRAAALLALDLDPTAVAVRDRLGDAQPQADALDLPLSGVPGAEEPAEDLVAVAHADADAGVEDDQLDAVVDESTSIRPPDGVYLTAFESRLSTTRTMSSALA